MDASIEFLVGLLVRTAVVIQAVIEIVPGDVNQVLLNSI